MLKYPVIAVDLDGTIISSRQSYPYIDKVDCTAIEVLNEYRKKGGQVIIWTLRTEEHLGIALDILRDCGLEWDAVNENVQSKIDEWESKYPNMEYSPKVCADLFIDDRNLGANITGFGWEVIRQEILRED